MNATVPVLIDHLFRRFAGGMVATLARQLGADRLELAEEVVQEAMVRALETWPYRGVPDNPAGWLARVARNRAIDRLRRETNLREKLVAWNVDDFAVGADADGAGGPFRDDELAMIFMCCHPAIPADARVALTLKVVGGFGVGEIARAFLVRQDAIAQRIVRAKRIVRERGVSLDLPSDELLPERLDAVLDVLYLLFSGGYEATEGEALVREDVCGEAIRLAQLLVAHEPTATPETHALLALMLFQASRFATRTDDEGAILQLADQDRSRWDRSLIDRALLHLDRSATGDRLTRFHLEAGIAACHALAPGWSDTDWPRIRSLYDELLAINGSPVVALNRAVAISMTDGAAAALEALEPWRSHPSLIAYFLLPVTTGELWEQRGDFERAACEYRAALALPCTEPERRFVERRLAAAEHRLADSRTTG